MVKEELKRQGVKISFIEAQEITKAARQLVAAQPMLFEEFQIADFSKSG